MASSVIKARAVGSMWGALAGDAIAMPVHWMYDLNRLKRDYGKITGYVAPKDNFEGSILNLSNTGGGGRGSDKGNIVGDVILHGKKKYWKKGGNYHYHLGLRAGENTLEAQLARLVVRVLSEFGDFNSGEFLSRYITFMTTPGSHNDTYASTCHRMFFANYVNGVSQELCADNDGHNVDAIDILTLAVPVIIHHNLRGSSREVRNRSVVDVVRATRRISSSVDATITAYADLLSAVLQGTDLREAVESCAQDLYGPSASVRASVERMGGSDPMVACYISSSFPALLHFAYKYADSVDGALLASANAGGENVARGFALGALLGAAHGDPNAPHRTQPADWLTEGLLSKDEISRELELFVESGDRNSAGEDL